MAPTVSDNAESSRYEIHDADTFAGFAEYYLQADVIAFLHTEIGKDFGGRGLGSTLIRYALDDARRRTLTVQPFCPFVRRFIAEHEDYRDLVSASDRARFGLG
ncbi:MAG: N-acetyltransferase [Pseudonocardiales bacterium]|nr:N-acetyltransferase [Pseudonocardiales bacterium]